ncbi:hypothetical protein ACIQ2D_21350 [Lysinibacillus sp. NPDC097287]|uniref:hypothetical protein n=1 Tax=Lysinibacillus sp. NPDC097287 TaxID=3364144 RepID=UPI00380E4C04
MKKFLAIIFALLIVSAPIIHWAITNPSNSVGFSKDVKVDDTMIQQIIKDSIKKVFNTENVTISEENIIIKIEQ